MTFRGAGERVEFYGTNGSITMYAPDTKLYTTIPAKATIDDNLAAITAQGIDMPVGPFLSGHLYELATKNLKTGYVIGRVKMYDQDVHQLAFTSPDVDWQLKKSLILYTKSFKPCTWMQGKTNTRSKCGSTTTKARPLRRTLFAISSGGEINSWQMTQRFPGPTDARRKALWHRL